MTPNEQAPIDNEAVARFGGWEQTREVDDYATVIKVWQCDGGVSQRSCPDMKTAVEMERLLVKLAEHEMRPRLESFWRSRGQYGPGKRRWLCTMRDGHAGKSADTPGEAVYKAVEAYLKWKEKNPK